MKSVGKKIYQYWMAFAGFLGRINSAIILSILFVVLIGIYALIQRLYQGIRTLFYTTPDAVSYWMDKKRRSATIEDMKRQF